MRRKIATTATNKKKKPSPDVVKTMKKRLQLEYKFYEFVRQRFRDLKEQLGVNSPSERGHHSWQQ